MTNFTIATWNVNGLRARQAQVQEWLERQRPDVACLQEIKATPDQIPAALWDMLGYWCYFHGGKGYSGVALLVSKALAPERPVVTHPAFDHEHRIAVAAVAGLTVASIYVPNGGKDFPAKMQFLRALDAYAEGFNAARQPLVLCGDLNVALTDRDVHPKERKPRAIGQLPEERVLLAQIIARGLVDVGRQVDPDNDGLFTWWAPWRQMRERNIGWRLDYVLASAALAARVDSCVVQRDVGNSDHAPVVATFTGYDSGGLTT
jgi:exodeoxyribonuclease III